MKRKIKGREEDKNKEHFVMTEDNSYPKMLL